MMFIGRSAIAAAGEMVSWARGRRLRVRVVGKSMVPTLQPGDHVLVDQSGSIIDGAIVVARHPTTVDQLVVKRVMTINGDGSVTLASDNPSEGTDSRTWGPLPAEEVVGTVTWVFGKPHALGVDREDPPPPLIR